MEDKPNYTRDEVLRFIKITADLRLEEFRLPETRGYYGDTKYVDGVLATISYYRSEVPESLRIIPEDRLEKLEKECRKVLESAERARLSGKPASTSKKRTQNREPSPWEDH